MTAPPPTVREALEAVNLRLKSKTVKSDGCWEWIGPRLKKGYGRIAYAGRTWATHRLVYFLTYGAIPDGLWVLHRCATATCVRPDHLYLGDGKQNAADREAHGRALWGSRNPQHKDTCIHGHAYTPENTRLRPGGDRQCRTCHRADARRQKERMRAKAQAETVELVAKAIHAALWGCPWDEDDEESREEVRAAARAGIAAFHTRPRIE